MKIFASEKALSALKKRAEKSKSYRIRLVGIGWGGPILEFVPGGQQENDYCEDLSGIKICVDKQLLKASGGFRIDYVWFLFRKGFYVSAQKNNSNCK